MKSLRLSSLESVVVACLLGGCAFLGNSVLFAADVAVDVVNNSFRPSKVTINVNDRVVWTWSEADGLIPHSVTSDTSGLWDSGVKREPFSFSQTFTSSGTFPYHCDIHAGMRGQVVVQGPPQLP